MFRPNIPFLARTFWLAALLALAGFSAHANPTPSAVPPDLIPASVPLVDPGLSVLWDVNSDGINDFNFNFRQPQTAGGVDWQANIFPLNGAAIIGAFNGEFYVTRLNAGDSIGSSSSFVGSPVQGIFGERFNGVDAGNFLPPNQQGYLGISIVSGANTYYGWVELQVARSTGGNFGIDFIRAAYETVPNTSILAGAVPEPSTVSILLLGGSGLALAAWRKRRR